MSIATTANGTLFFNGPADAVPGAAMAPFFNFKMSNTLRLRAGLARQASGKGNCIIVPLGDSNTTGHGAGTDGSGYTGGATRNFPYTLANLLGGGKHFSESFFGTQNITTWTTIGFDPRLTLGAGWDIGTDGGASLGAWMLKFDVASPSVLAFTPTVAFDTIQIYYPINAGLGSFTTNIDGGASLGTTSEAGAQAFTSVTYTVTRGTHTINLTPTGSGVTAPVYIAGVCVRDSTNPSVEVWNWGYDGSRAQDHLNTSFPWTNLNAYPSVTANTGGANIHPDCFILNLMLNDANMNTSITSYMTSMQTLITQLKTASDVVMMVPSPPAFSQGVSAITPAILQSYMQAYYGLAITNNLPLIDNIVRSGSYAAIQPLGYTFNELHPSQTGYGDTAEGTLRALNSMA